MSKGQSDDGSITRTVSLLPVFFSFALSVCPVSPRWQRVSEPAYGFILFDYISGAIEGQTDRQEAAAVDRQTEGESQRELGREWMMAGGEEGGDGQADEASLGESVLTNRGGAGFQV